MQARQFYEFYMHEHNLFLNIIVELRRNTVEIVLDFLCKKYTLGINLVYCAANSNFQCTLWRPGSPNLPRPIDILNRRHLSIIPRPPLTQLHNPRITSFPFLIPRPQNLKQLGQSRPFPNDSPCLTVGMERIGFGVGDDLIGDAAEFFGFGEGGDDSFVVDEGCYHVAQHGRGLNRERSFCASIIPAAQDLARSFIVTLIFFRRDISQSSILPTAFTGFANGMTS